MLGTEAEIFRKTVSEWEDVVRLERPMHSSLRGKEKKIIKWSQQKTANSQPSQRRDKEWRSVSLHNGNVAKTCFECLLKYVYFSLLGFFVPHPLSPSYIHHITIFFHICKHQGHPEAKPRWSIRCKFALAKRILVAGSCDTALSFYLESFELESDGLKNSHNTLQISPSVYQSFNCFCSPLWWLWKGQ